MGSYESRTVASLIEEALSRSGLTSSELARGAGIRPAILAGYISRTRQPRAATLVRILAAAGFRADLQPLIDHERNARILHDVLELAERLPFRPTKTLRYPLWSTIRKRRAVP
jgi:transcriptional regulator with XRE-family HTH domain